MMTMKEITAILKCSRVTAESALRQAGIQKKVISFAHGRKNLFDVTAAQLPEIMASYNKDPSQIAMQQSAALGALEAAFGCRQPAGGQNALNR